MLPLKKYFTEGLIQFTILLSLMGVRLDVDSYLNAQLPPLREIILGQSSAYTQTQFHNWRNSLGGYDLHPKSVDLDYYFTARRLLLNDVRGLDRLLVPSTELSAWLVHGGREADSSVAASQPALPLDNSGGVTEASVAESSGRDNGSPPEQLEETLGAVGLPMSSELTKEDIDLIDVLWRQDIDLGAGREVFDYSCRQKENEHGEEEKRSDEESENGRDSLLQSVVAVDGETGERLPAQVPDVVEQASSFEECLRLLEETFPFAADSQFPAAVPSELNEALDSALSGTSESLATSSQAALLSPLQPSETPLDLEQHWQDLMSLMELQDMEVVNRGTSFHDDAGGGVSDLSVSYDQPPATAINHDVSLHDATLPSCGQDFQPFFNPNLENPPTGLSPAPGLRQQAPTNSTSFDATFGCTNFTGLLFPHAANGTGNETGPSAMPDSLSRLLDEAMLDEISLMDLAMEEGFGPMASQIEEELDSDSGLSLDSSQSPVSPSNSESSSSSSSASSSSSLSFSEEGAVGYSTDSEAADSEEGEGAVGGYQPEFSKFCRMSYQNPSFFGSLPHLDPVNHNHTYNLPPGASISGQQPYPTPGKKAALKEAHPSRIDLHLGRDERRARVLKIPFSNDKIINLPVDEFNELLSKYHLTEAQLTLIRDIRRRGKNKLAAQNCRKRKLDTILNLDHDVEHLKRQRARLLKENGEFARSLRQMKQKLQELYHEVFARLRDEEGRPYSPSQYSLQYGNDGSMLVMPRALTTQQGKPDKKNGKKK